MTKRLTAKLDIKSPNLVKTIRLEGLRVVGDPHEYATEYDSQGIDEIVYLDIVASLYGRNHLAELVSRTAADVFVPLTVGGGVRSIEDARELLKAGADKIALNTAAVKRPGLIAELANKFGSQCVVVQIDAKRLADGWQAWCDGGRQPTGKDAIEWAEQAVKSGAGEILLTSIDREGTGLGFDTDLIEAVSRKVPVPVVASGGMGVSEDAVRAMNSGAAAVAMSRVLHYKTVPLQEIRLVLRNAGWPVRMAS